VRALVIFLVVGCICGFTGCTGPGVREKAGRYNVILITLDTTRADYVDTGNSAGARAFTPGLKRFAKKSIAFENAYCTIPQTLPSHLSLFTSYFPYECGVLSNQYQYDGRHKMLPEVLKERGYHTAGIISLGTLASSTGFPRGFDVFLENLNDESVFYTPAERVTLEASHILKQVKAKKEPFFLFLHYSDPHSPYAPPTVQGDFKIYLDFKPGQGNPQPIAKLNPHRGAILRKTIPLSSGVHEIHFKLENHQEDFEGFVLRRLEFSKNCSVSFRNIEYSPTHYNGSYLLKGEEGTIRVKCKGTGSVKLFQIIPHLTWKAAINYYRLEVEYMDHYVGKFLGKLEEEKLLHRTIVVITGDHGEGLGERERYFGHVRYLNRQFIHVPLLLYLPGMKASRVKVPVSHVGVTPTILEFMGIDYPGFSRDKSLMPVIRNKSTPGERSPVYSFASRPSAIEDKFSFIYWPYQCILTMDDSGGETTEFYNLSLSQSFRKWDEISPAVLARNSLRIFHSLQKSVYRMRTAFKIRSTRYAKLNKKEIEKLKTMGYIH
jgi:membrane-anchored protein YejM (alkaline phosphatase superfamily)